MEGVTLTLGLIFLLGFLIMYIVKTEYKKIKKKLNSLISDKRRLDKIDVSITDNELTKVNIQDNINEVLSNDESFMKINFKKHTLEEIFYYMSIFNRHLCRNLLNSSDDKKREIGKILERYTGLYTTFDPQNNVLICSIDSFREKNYTVTIKFYIN